MSESSLLLPLKAPGATVMLAGLSLDWPSITFDNSGNAEKSKLSIVVIEFPIASVFSDGKSLKAE